GDHVIRVRWVKDLPVIQVVTDRLQGSPHVRRDGVRRVRLDGPNREQFDVEREKIEAVETLPDLQRLDLSGASGPEHGNDVGLNVRVLASIAAADVKRMVLVAATLMAAGHEVYRDAPNLDPERDVLALHRELLPGKERVEALIELLHRPVAVRAQRDEQVD